MTCTVFWMLQVLVPWDVLMGTWDDWQDTEAAGAVWLFSICYQAGRLSLRNNYEIIFYLSSTRVQHKVGSRDEMRWSPYFIGPWVARVPADHAWRTITRADETKWMRWVWKNGGMKFVVGENGRNPVKNLPRPRFVHHETHMEGPRCKLGTPAVGGERLTACATRLPQFPHKICKLCFEKNIHFSSFSGHISEIWTLSALLDVSKIL